MAPTKPETPAPIEGPLPAAVLDKYKAASTVASSVLTSLISKVVVGANVLELCNDSDAAIEKGTAGLYNKVKGVPKGIAFPTSISVNSILQNYSPLPSDPVGSVQVLAEGDVVKIVLGAHIDGYAVVSGETVVVTSGKVDGVRGDLLAAVHNAAEVAIRLVKPGGKNWEVTEGIKSVLAEYEAAGIKGVEGVLSHQHEQNSIEAKKGIVAFPSEQQRRDGDNAFTFEEGEVYGLNILVTNGEKTPKPDASRTTIYQKTPSTTYALKLKTSRATYSEISKKAGSFPFTLRTLEEEGKARMGVRECVAHGLVKAWDVSTTDRPVDLSAQIFLTFAITKTGAIKLSAPPTFYSAEKVESSVEIKNEEVKSILARPLKAKVVKAKKAAVAVEEKTEA